MTHKIWTLLTHRELLVLEYLNPLMHATVLMIGRHIWDHHQIGGSNLPGLGAAFCGRLRKRGLVERLDDIGRWRITSAGREAIGR